MQVKQKLSFPHQKTEKTQNILILDQAEKNKSCERNSIFWYLCR